jgi:hypothetical protein
MGIYIDYYLVTDFDESCKSSIELEKYEIDYRVGEKIVELCKKEENKYIIKMEDLKKIYSLPIESNNMYIIQTYWCSYSIEEMNEPNDISFFIKIVS